jgi:hypothetical protein
MYLELPNCPKWNSAVPPVKLLISAPAPVLQELPTPVGVMMRYLVWRAVQRPRQPWENAISVSAICDVICGASGIGVDRDAEVACLNIHISKLPVLRLG